MPRTGEASSRIMGSFQGRAADFGFALPPMAMRLKLLKAGSHWTVFVQSSADVPVAKLVEWFPPEGLARIEFGSRRVVRADYQPLPEAWALAFDDVTLDLAWIEPDGKASVTISGSRRAIAAFARRLFGRAAPVELVKLRAVDPPATFLTLPQDEALRAAVAEGYYRIPRALNLKELAAKLGITSASLSERLRRAEDRIITRYVHAGSASPWDEMTIFDEDLPGAAPVEWPDAGKPAMARKVTE